MGLEVNADILEISHEEALGQEFGGTNGDAAAVHAYPIEWGHGCQCHPVAVPIQCCVRLPF